MTSIDGSKRIIEPIDEMEVVRKDRLLENLLDDISIGLIPLDGDDVKRYAMTLREVYEGGYRQMYSRLYPMISRISDKSDDPEVLDILMENLITIRKHVGECHGKDPNHYGPELFGHVLKLEDHIILEIQRMIDANVVHTELSDVESDLSAAEKRMDLYSKRVSKLDKKVDIAERRLQGSQTESVVILGIFAAIVMAFSGGLSMLGGSMEAMVVTTPYKIMFVTLLCGLILFDKESTLSIVIV